MRSLLCALALAGCGVEPSSVESEQIETAASAASVLSTRLAAALADGFLSSTEWTTRIAPLAQQLPRIATPEGNTLAVLWADHPAQIAGTAREPIRVLLDAWGYPVPKQPSQPIVPGATMIADNLTTPDTDFETIAAAAGVPADATIAVAVLDDGILFSHPALAGHELAVPGTIDFVDNDRTLPVTDHGTAVASIAARGGQRVKVLLLRIAVNSGIPATLAFGAVVSAAIDKAAAEHVTVVSISYVTNRPADTAAIRAAMARYPDILFVLAAGNGNTQLGGPGLEPEKFLATMHADNVVVVANANRDGTRFQSSFDGSNYGTPYVDVAMRGIDYPLAIASGAYGRSRGTSSATPNVAAVAARIRLIDPALSAAEVKALLLATVQPQPAWTGLVNAGGTVDQARAIRAAAGL
jgi:hypothetical protein